MKPLQQDDIKDQEKNKLEFWWHNQETGLSCKAINKKEAAKKLSTTRKKIATGKFAYRPKNEYL